MFRKKIRVVTESSAKTIRELARTRKNRRLAARSKAVELGWKGGLSGTGVGVFLRTPATGVLATTLGLGGVSAIVAGSAEYSAWSGDIKKATHLVGNALHAEQKTNEKLRALLQKKKYVFINKHNEVVGTNVQRLVAGRLRLSSKDILAGKD